MVVVIVRVEDPAPVIAVGLKVAEEPEGNPLTFSTTLPSNPFMTMVDTV